MVTLRARRAAAALLGAAALALLGFVALEGARLRHLAVPTLRDPSAPRARAVAPEALAACRAEEVLRTSGRVSALAETRDGRLYVGHFDRGVVVVEPGGAARAVEGLLGRERFVNALLVHEGAVWAATQGGLLVVRGDAPPARLLEGEGVTGLAAADGALFAATAGGVYRIRPGEPPEPLALRGPDGEPLRVTALTAGEARLFVGTASGVFSVPRGAPAHAPARWHPLVFGDPGADTNVVTALAPFPGGAVAGTDDGGLVRLLDDGRVVATRLLDPRANEVNPGAAAAVAGAAVFGTQGGGLLVARAGGGAALAIGRPAALERESLSAVAAGESPGGLDALIVGTGGGRVLRLACPGRAGAPPPTPRAAAPRRRGARARGRSRPSRCSRR